MRNTDALLKVNKYKISSEQLALGSPLPYLDSLNLSSSL